MEHRGSLQTKWFAELLERITSEWIAGDKCFLMLCSELPLNHLAHSSIHQSPIRMPEPRVVSTEKFTVLDDSTAAAI